MTGGSLGQARRRSTEGTGSAAGSRTASALTGGRSVAVAGGQSAASSSLATAAATAAAIGGTNGRPTYDVMMKEPSHQDTLQFLGKKVQNSPLKTIPEKLKILEAAMKHKNLWIEKAGTLTGNDAHGSPIGQVVAQRIRNAVPNSVDKARTKGPELAVLLLDTHNALKAYVTQAEGPITRTLRASFDPLAEMVDFATSLARQNELKKLDSSLPCLAPAEFQRGFCMNGYLPIALANQQCFACGHFAVDEPDTNKVVQQKHLEDLVEWEKKKEDIKKAGTGRAPTKPKQKAPYRQCHCHQATCTSATHELGMTCPIKCKDPTGRRYPYEHGYCKCPLCSCTCFVAYGFNAPAAIHVRNQLDAGAAEQAQIVEKQRSTQVFASVVTEAFANTLGVMVEQNKATNMTPTAAQTQSVAMGNAALAVVNNMDPSFHKAFTGELRNQFGPPGNRAALPVPVTIGGKQQSIVDARMISKNKSGHRVNNNNLKTTGLDTNNSGVPIQLYKDAAGLPPSQLGARLLAASTPDTQELFGMGEDDGMGVATQNSLIDQTKDPDLLRGIQASLQHAAASIGGGSTYSTAVPIGTPEPGTGNTYNLIYSPQPPPAAARAPTSKGKGTIDLMDDTPVKRALTYKERVQDRALNRFIGASPLASKVMGALGDKNNTVATDALAGLKRQRPDADSQEGYKFTKSFMETLWKNDDNDE